MRYYFIAGEASGDLHASYVIRELKKKDPGAELRGWGGDLMQREGMELDQHYRDAAFMGFYEVIANLRTILGNIRRCKRQIVEFQPDALILVDYPGFNLQIARFASKQPFPVFYYIAPKAWAWKESRARKIKSYVDQLYSILPFEIPFFEKYGVNINYVGNPLLDQLDSEVREEERQDFMQNNNLDERPLLALFPGSRKQEISGTLPRMLEAVARYSDYQVVIGGAPGLERSSYHQYIEGKDNIKVVFNQGHQLMKYAAAALITSGTATLEAALLNLPQVICYRGNAVSVAIARRLVKVKYIGLANLIMDEAIITELIQEEMSVEKMQKELDSLLFDDDRRLKLFSDYDRLRKEVGGPGASARVAEGITAYLSTFQQEKR